VEVKSTFAEASSAGPAVEVKSTFAGASSAGASTSAGPAVEAKSTFAERKAEAKKRCADEDHQDLLMRQRAEQQRTGWAKRSSDPVQYGSSHVGADMSQSDDGPSDNDTMGSGRSSKHWRRKGPSAARRQERRTKAWESRMKSRHEDWDTPDPITGEGLHSPDVGAIPKESADQYCSRVFSSLAGGKLQKPSSTLVAKVTELSQASGRCVLCDKAWQKEHASSQGHAALLAECESLNTLCGFRADRRLWSIATKPVYGIPDQTSFAEHWGGPGTCPTFFRERFLAEARKALCESGFLLRTSSTKAQEHFHPDADNVQMDLYAVPYKGDGKYEDTDVALRYSELPRGPGEPGAAPVFPTQNGWWPVASVQFEFHIAFDPDRMVDGVVLTVIVVICLYQWTYRIPVAWRIWARRSRL
jgi:hypothetical protein